MQCARQTSVEIPLLVLPCATNTDGFTAPTSHASAKGVALVGLHPIQTP